MSFMGNMIGNKALAAHGKNEYEKAMQLYDEAYEKGMDKPRLLRGYSVLLIRTGHFDKALEVLKKIEALPGLTPAEKGDAEAALAFNKEALDYDDTDPVYLDNMGQTYYRLVGDKKTAKTFFDKAIALKPSAIDTNYFLSLYDIEAGDTEKAIERLKTARGGFFSPLNYATPEMIDARIAELGAK